MASGTNNNVWVSSDAGLINYQFNTGNVELVNKRSPDTSLAKSWYKMYVERINALHTDEMGNLWIGFKNGDLSRMAGELYFKSITSEQLLRNWPILYELKDGSVWFGNGRDQVTNFFDPRTEILTRKAWSVELPRCDFCDVIGHYDQNTLFILLNWQLWTQDLLHFELLPIEVPGLPADFAKNIRPDNVNKYQSFADDSNRLWVGTPKGLYILDGDKEFFKYIDLDSFPRYSVNFDFWIKEIHFSQNSLAWLITTDGLYSYDLETGIIEQHGADPAKGDILAGSIINCFYEDNSGTVWVSVLDCGLSRYNPLTREIRIFTTEDGLPNNVVQSIVGDEKNGAVWLSTMNGLSRFDIEKEQCTNFSVRDGLQGLLFGERRGLKTRDGYIFFTGHNGVTYFHPDSFPSYSITPRLHFTDFRYVNRPIEQSERWKFTTAANNGEALHLKHNQNSISIGYTGIQYDDPFKNNYSYTLENFSDEWFDVGNQRTAQFSSLKPGEYTFKVKAANRHGVWTDEPLSLRILIAPPWWATLYAYLAYLLLGAIMIWQGGHYLKQRTLSKEREAVRKRSDEAKMQFFTNVSHELRTPLTVISGMADQLDPEKRETYLIKKNTQILQDLVGQILDLRKLDAGTLKVNFVQGDIMSYLRYVCEIFEVSAAQKDINLSCHGPASFVMDYDPEKLMRIVSNLLSNAIKFTPSGGKIELDVIVDQDKDPEEFMLNIRDSGIGIREEALEQIFERYYQVEQTGNESDPVRSGTYWSSGAGGTGIGLAIVKEYTGLLGGKVSVKSRPGEGTTFRVHLPVTRTAPFTDTPDQISLPNIKKESQEFLAENNHSDDDLPIVLIVEDNADVAGYIESCLQGSYQTYKASNGKKGIDAALEHMPDVVISDVMMPELGGFELCNILKTDLRTSHIPVILLTAKADMDSKITGLSAGADAYLVKPFNKTELLVRLEAAIALREKLRLRYSTLTIPETPADDQMTREDEFIQRVQQTIQDHLDESEFSTGSLAEECSMSERQLQLKVKALTGKTPVLLMRTMRLQKASSLLLNPDLRVSEIAYDVGFTDPAYFSRVFTSEFGVSPSEWRRQSVSS